MKLAITSSGNNLQSSFDMRFGRAAWFCVYDTETKYTEFIQNESTNGGAGTKAAEKMAQLGVSQIFSGDFGPKAKTMLERFRIQMIILNEKKKTIQEVVNKIMEE